VRDYTWAGWRAGDYPMAGKLKILRWKVIEGERVGGRAGVRACERAGIDRWTTRNVR